MADKNKVDTGDYERLGRAVESVFASAYANRRRVFWFSFLRGIAFGFGAALGGSLLLAILLYTLSQLTDIPLVGDVADTIRNSIQGN